MKILLPFDGSTAALEAVLMAIRLADGGLNTSVVLANVQEPASLYEMVTLPDPAALDDTSYAAGEHVLQAAQQLLEQAGIPYATAVATGDPVHALVDLIEEQGCELVVMGSRSSGAFLSALQGSVSQSLAHASPVPVLLVKPPAELVAPRDLPEDVS